MSTRKDNKGLVTLVARQTTSHDTAIRFAKIVLSNPRSAETMVVFASPTAKKTAPNARTARNTSANSSTNGALKSSNFQEYRQSSKLHSTTPDEVNSLRQQPIVLSTCLEKFES